LLYLVDGFLWSLHCGLWLELFAFLRWSSFNLRGMKFHQFHRERGEVRLLGFWKTIKHRRINSQVQKKEKLLHKKKKISVTDQKNPRQFSNLTNSQHCFVFREKTDTFREMICH